MENNSRIRFNPVTKEIEVEGTESFVKKYFNKLQAMISGPADEKVAVRKATKPVKVPPVKADKKKPRTVKALRKKTTLKVAKRKPGEKRITNFESVIGLVRNNPGGISTAVLKEETGLTEIQIWNIVNRAAKAGQIRKMKRGLYGPSGGNQG
ncbi:MAG: hypothetical protein ACYDHW_16870 [Syntrophorhabdaceae bacterium]